MSKANSSASTTRAAIPRVVAGSAEMAITYPLWHDYFRTPALRESLPLWLWPVVLAYWLLGSWGSRRPPLVRSPHGQRLPECR